jgi:hypothetical protein
MWPWLRMISATIARRCGVMRRPRARRAATTSVSVLVPHESMVAASCRCNIGMLRSAGAGRPSTRAAHGSAVRPARAGPRGRVGAVGIGGLAARAQKNAAQVETSPGRRRAGRSRGRAALGLERRKPEHDVDLRVPDRVRFQSIRTARPSSGGSRRCRCARRSAGAPRPRTRPRLPPLARRAEMLRQPRLRTQAEPQERFGRARDLVPTRPRSRARRPLATAVSGGGVVDQTCSSEASRAEMPAASQGGGQLPADRSSSASTGSSPRRRGSPRIRARKGRRGGADRRRARRGASSR